MELDLSRLAEIADKKFETKEKNIENDLPLLQREADNRKDELDRAREVYKIYQENILLAGELETEILKGLKQGENIYKLFLKAVKAISLIMGDDEIYCQAESDIKAIYGAGFLEPEAIEIELNLLEARLNKLKDALERENELEVKRRIAVAIEAHEEKISRIKRTNRG